MKKILVLSEFREKIISELSGEFEIITEYDGTVPDLVITDPDYFDERVPLTAKTLAVFYENCPIYNLYNEWDGFIIYPFHRGELYTRVINLLDNSFKNGALTIDFTRCNATLDGKSLHLTLLEYKLLCLLARCCGATVDYQTIMRELWESPIGSEILSVRVFVNALRKKLGDEKDLIKTVMGKGYMMPIIDKFGFTG